MASINQSVAIPRANEGSDPAVAMAMKFVHLLGSLKLTVILFALSMVIVLVGSLAQEDLNMVQVKERYFTSWIAMMHLEDFVPQSFVRHDPISAAFPFPGGKLIGSLLMLNLVAAKATRFILRARGTSLFVGVAIIGAALGLCWYIAAAAHTGQGVQGQVPVDGNLLRRLLFGGFVFLTIASFYLTFSAQRRGWRIMGWITGSVLTLFCLSVVFRFISLDDPGLRITWQLIKGTLVGCILYLGCRIVFGIQAGNVVLHFGVALLMVSQFAFGDRQLEQNLKLVEGEATNVLINEDKLDLTFQQRLPDGKIKVSAVALADLEGLEGTGEKFSHESLPFDLEVVSILENSQMPEEQNASAQTPADQGMGKSIQIREVPPFRPTESFRNIVSAYIKLYPKGSEQPLGTYLVSQLFNDASALGMGQGADQFDTVKSTEGEYQIGLRFRRIGKPYWVHLRDVRRINYSGSDTPRDYSSFISLYDPRTGDKREERIWMNNPLRYQGETFYQSEWSPAGNGKERTVLQVVRNAGWMLPYLACMIVAVGMLAHFLQSLDRFVGRRERELKNQPGEQLESPIRVGRSSYVAFGVMSVVCAAMLIPPQALINAMRPAQRNAKADFYAAGEIPVQFGGRIMPLDAVASQMLKGMSNRTSLRVPENAEKVRERLSRLGWIQKRTFGPDEPDRLPALAWLFEIASPDRGFLDVPMIYIDAEEVLGEFSLTRTEKHLYTLAQLADGLDEHQAVVRRAAEKSRAEKPLTFEEEKALDLSQRLNLFETVSVAFAKPTPDPLPPDIDASKLSPEQRIRAQWMMVAQRLINLESKDVPCVIPPSGEGEGSEDRERWMPFSTANFMSMIASDPSQVPATALTFEKLVDAYSAGDASAFNAAIDAHMKAVDQHPAAGYLPWRVKVERWMTASDPTMVARVLYGFAALFSALAVFHRLRSLRSVAFWILLAIFCVHTAAIVARVLVTGRAPVINLFSSAVFIGWALVLASLVFEGIFRRGICNVLAAVTGLLSLMVASALATGDTMPVLQAVLDTQFWLATHVISVTLGYAATFLAGFLGIAYLVWTAFNSRDESMRFDLYRMMYGTICFGILFSFVGTVLGGLWADDSWGRFWGWDPKENGALLIVIWNALMLHARWDRMVGPRGLAMLAVGGNIVTAWSWFGTNQLGIGLHSYGFTSGTLMWLSLFAVSQVLVISLGWFVMRRTPEGDQRLA